MEVLDDISSISGNYWKICQGGIFGSLCLNRVVVWVVDLLTLRNLEEPGVRGQRRVEGASSSLFRDGEQDDPTTFAEQGAGCSRNFVELPDNLCEGLVNAGEGLVDGGFGVGGAEEPVVMRVQKHAMGDGGGAEALGADE